MIDLIIPTYNNPHLLKRCLRSLSKMVHTPHVTTIADDASTDEEMRKWLIYLNITGYNVIVNKTRLGFIGNCNNAVAKTKGQLICLLNQDTQALSDFLAVMAQTLRDDPQIGIVGAKLLYSPEKPDLAGTIQHVGIARAKNRSPHHPFRGAPADDPCANVERFVNAVTGACMMVRREVWNQLGGFDAETFKMGQFEDVDFCWRARRAGWKIKVVPRAVLYHLEHGCGEQYVAEAHDHNRQALLRRWRRLKSDEELFQC